MFAKWKNYFFILIIFFLWGNLFSENINIKLISGDNNEYSYLQNPVLDNTSVSNLPYLIYNFDNKHIKNIEIDSFKFLNPINIEREVFNFSGNKPLSFEYKENKTAFKGILKADIFQNKNNKSIKIMPFDYDGIKLIAYKELQIFYSVNYEYSVKADPIYDYLIICTQDYDTAFQRFKNWKIRQGYKTELFTVEYIDTNYTGIDKQEKIRNFIIDEYNNNHFNYVLLCGDSTLIPVRKMFALECGAGYYYDEDSIPADMYYFNLDGNFDANGNNIYGEISDSADLIPEVYGGRVQFDTIYFGPSANIDRMIAYEQTLETEHLSRGIFIGMILWDDPMTPGGEAKRQIDNEIIPDYYNIKSFYEIDGHSGKADILDSMNVGYGIINHVGHGSYKGIWVDSISANVIGRGDAQAMANGNKTGLFYSIGCWVGAFDKEDGTSQRNFAGCLEMGFNGGCTSVIANSRYGWGAPGYPGWGVSDIFDYKFFELLFNSENKEVGYLLATLKNQFEPYSYEENLYRWHLYEINLFGDPSMFIHTQIPDSVFISKRIENNKLKISVFDKNNKPIDNLLVCISKDTIIDRGLTYNGYIELIIDTSETDYMYLTISGANYMTILDSVLLSNEVNSEISLQYDLLYNGIDNVLTLTNNTADSINTQIVSSIFDTSINISALSDTNLIYSVFWNEKYYDSLFITYNGKTDSYFLYTNDAFEINNINIYDNLFEITIDNLSGITASNCSINFYIVGDSIYLDTFDINNIDSNFIFNSELNIPLNEDYIGIYYNINKNDQMISADSIYANNGEYIFIDNFENGFDNWGYIDSLWIITSNRLHCGSDSSYYPNMNQTIISNEFTVYPNSVCSINIDFSMPVLEFDSLGPVYNLDGLFIKIISSEDTSILDFISSGGALNEEKLLTYNGWMVYNLNYEIPTKIQLLFQFVSDHIEETAGVFIDEVRIVPEYYFLSYDSINDENENYSMYRESDIITKDITIYSLPEIKDYIKTEVYSIDGRIVKTINNYNTNRIIVNFNDLSSGIYIIRHYIDYRIYHDKIIYMR